MIVFFSLDQTGHILMNLNISAFNKLLVVLLHYKLDILREIESLKIDHIIGEIALYRGFYL